MQKSMIDQKQASLVFSKYSLYQKTNADLGKNLTTNIYYILNN